MTSDARRDAARLADLLRTEQLAMADVLLALVDFDRRRGWAALGHASLWAFLHHDLRLSAGAAFQRKEAATLLRRVPAVEVPLREGRLCLSSVAELAKVLTPENQAEVLPRFFGKSAREAREEVAAIVPRAVVPARVVVTAVAPAKRAGATLLTSETEVTQPARGSAPSTPTPTPASTSTSTPTPSETLTPTVSRATAEPLTADLRRRPPIAANLRLLCRAHNAEAARRVYGADFVARVRLNGWRGRGTA